MSGLGADIPKSFLVVLCWVMNQRVYCWVEFRDITQQSLEHRNGVCPCKDQTLYFADAKFVLNPLSYLSSPASIYYHF